MSASRRPGRPPGPWHPRAPGTHYDYVKPSPRVRLAAALYGSGIAPTKAAASAAAGLAPTYLAALANNPAVNQLVNQAAAATIDRTADTATLLQQLGREALFTIDDLRRDPAMRPDIRLRAAIDLADRSSETSKIQRHALTSFSLEGQDAKELAKAMVESARVKMQWRETVKDGWEPQTSVSAPEPPAQASSTPPAGVGDEQDG